LGARVGVGVGVGVGLGLQLAALFFIVFFVFLLGDRWMSPYVFVFDLWSLMADH
jgi:hypothetical protein